MVDKAQYYAGLHGLDPADCAPTDSQDGTGPQLIGPHAADILAIADDDPGFVAWQGQQQRIAWKQNRQLLVDAIKVTTLAGHTFDGDETSQTRMTRAIAALLPDETIIWVLADNSVIQATRAELTEALRLAGRAQEEIWVMP